MESNNETLFNRLSSFSSRASKIPQRLARASLFSLKPSISSNALLRPAIQHQSKSDLDKPYYSLPKTAERKPRTTLDFGRLEPKEATKRPVDLPSTTSSSTCSSVSIASSSQPLSPEDWLQRLEEKCLLLLAHKSPCLFQEIAEELDFLVKACEIHQEFKKPTTEALLVQQVRSIQRLYTPPPSYCVESEKFNKETPRLFRHRPTIEDYDQTDLETSMLEASWFRHHFIGQAYITLLSAEQGMVITIVQEQNDYRIILRSKGVSKSLCYRVSSKKTKETQRQLENKGRRFFFLRKEIESMQSALYSVCPQLETRSFLELSAESTRLAGLEKDLLRYDEMAIPEHYKFGVLNIKRGQTTEKAWFRNTGCSENLQDFLNLMGHKVSLKGYRGYAGGLDKKADEAGEYTFVSKWKEKEIAFHVAPIMPLKKNDDQQVLRKRYIGNDIVSIIFIEDDQPFDPKMIVSNFVFVYIVVRPERVGNERQWRVEVIKHRKIDCFDPPIPSPPLFQDHELKSFLTLKMIHAEGASLRSERLSTPYTKARSGLLTTYIKHAQNYHPIPAAKKKTAPVGPASSRLLAKAQRPSIMTASSADIPILSPTRSSSVLLGFARKKKEPSKLSQSAPTDLDVRIGQNIQISSESFISTEQLFATSLS
ncbi:hypothetical protein BY458DRAFT_571965 [Sporodiniella umbellata]|nr:hypothetical protein BY458DRAFT_571965 [Sporodiniella umbellata]